jgi:hypothetical protein
MQLSRSVFSVIIKETNSKVCVEKNPGDSQGAKTGNTLVNTSLQT